MSLAGEDLFINGQSVEHPLSEIRDCVIAVDAAYYIHTQLEAEPHEPLLPALAGLTGIRSSIEADLDQWKANGMVPYFVFDGQPITGQDETTVVRSLQSNKSTDHAWELYFGSKALEAVQAFGQHTGAFNTRNLFPLLQEILRERGLHFLVAPYNAAAQLAYFELSDSDQCSGVMGPLELMLYPINDCIIRSINWDTQTVTAVSKKHILKALNVTDESLLVDAILMTGTSFLLPFPPLVDPTLTKNQPHTVSDALNVLRAAVKSVTQACNAYQDVLEIKDATWLDKYRKARMAVDHFIYIAESGEVRVHAPEGLTVDAHEYLGVQLPSELFHYLNTGLIGPRLLSWITHGRMEVLPTIDGFVSDEYKNLVEKGSVRIKEMALSIVEPRLNRGISHKPITMGVWYDRSRKYTMAWESEGKGGTISRQVASWNVAPSSIKAHFPKFQHGSILSEVTALQNPEFAASTMAGDGTKMKGIKPAGLIQSVCLWRFLHLRGYVDDSHTLTHWGKALAATLSALEPTVKKHAEVPNLYEHALVAIELIRHDLLHAGNKHDELRGYPMNGTEEDRASLLLISRCATLLKLRHKANGYTGPLSKNLLCFRSLASEVRSADRDLIEALVASMFLYAQADRKRTDGWELSHQLPFLSDPDVALGIAVKTYFDEIGPNASAETKADKKANFPLLFMPHVLAFEEDLEIACNFFDAIYAGVKLLDSSAMVPSKRQQWDKAAEYLALRR
ncbi:protein MKT1 [Podospora conica]|nr:protein MKT1 [Schizothecium conicum]